MSDETKHTPGPWEYIGCEITSHGGRGVVCIMPMTMGVPDGTEKEANARLIAAAPELAEAVRLVLARLDAPKDENLLRLALDSDRAEKACRAALEKAGLL